jgi:hypothetical protein
MNGALIWTLGNERSSQTQLGGFARTYHSEMTVIIVKPKVWYVSSCNEDHRRTASRVTVFGTGDSNMTVILGPPRHTHQTNVCEYPFLSPLPARP